MNSGTQGIENKVIYCLAFLPLCAEVNVNI